MEPTTDHPARASDQQPDPAALPPPPPAVPPVPDASTGAPTMGPVPSAARPRFALRRSRTDRMLAGVCGGLAESLGVDAALIRIALVALTVFGAGAGVVFYVAAWILAPESDAG